jgi:hypothetical protein
MPTIIAICPYCRAGGVRAPASNIGASATCPKCKSSFTVMPSDGLPGWAKEPQASSPAPTPAAAPPAPLPVDETQPAAAMGMADVTEPSPTLPREERAKVKAKPKPAPTPEAEPEPEPEQEEAERAEPADMGLVTALVALILVGIAVLASQFPFGRFIAIGIAAVGLLTGLMSLGAEGRAKQAGGLAVGLHVLVLVFVLFLPSWLRLDPWRGAPDEGPKGPFAVEHGTGLLNPISPTDWIDASKSSWEDKDVRVTVRSAFVGPVELHGPKDAKRTTKDRYFHLLLRVANTGVERQIELKGWAAGKGADGVRVIDSTGKQLSLATFDDGWAPTGGRPAERAMPGHASEVRLVFVAPAKPDSLRLHLPGAAIGAGEEIKFHIGSGFLNRNAPQ